MLKISLALLILIVTITVCCGSISVLDKYAIFPSLPPGAELSNNTICADHSRIYRMNLDKSILWAYEMWDSTAISTVGVLTGNVFHMGNFDECLAVEAPFSTQYCFVTLQASVPEIKRNDPLSLYHDPNESVLGRLYYNGDESQQPRNIAKIGWCTPASCKPEDLQAFLNDYVKNSSAPLIVKNQINFTVSLSSVDCQSYKDQKRFDTADISFCILSMILILTVIIATIFDGNQSKDSRSKKLLMAFSLKRNLATLIRVDDSDPALAILHGVRIFAIIGVIFGHRVVFFIAGPILNMDYIEAQFQELSTVSILRTDLFVDTFFTLSGILVTYNLLGKVDWKTINPGFVILLRYIRLTPVLGFMIFFYSTLFNYTGSGPLWKQIVTEESTNCRTNWWTNLLYLNNYINVSNMCIAQSWYLPCDFHYFLIAICVCLAIRKNHRFGLFLIFLFSSISIMITFFLTLIYEQSGIMRFYPQFLQSVRTNLEFILIYNKSHTRAAPYFIGMLTGYIYHKLKGTYKQISKLQSYTILILSLIMILISSSGGVVYYNPYHTYNKYESALYGALNRPIFALGNVGILYVASYGHCKWIYNVLSWKPWIVLGKLVYCVYLVHLSFQLHAFATLENSRKFHYYHQFTGTILDIVLSLFVALVLHLVIETPLKQICKEIFFPIRDLKETAVKGENVKVKDFKKQPKT